jgi:hypothetical protein
MASVQIGRPHTWLSCGDICTGRVRVRRPAYGGVLSAGEGVLKALEAASIALFISSGERTGSFGGWYGSR